jgi:RNA polymerase sigma factor (sigma-70 family)
MSEDGAIGADVPDFLEPQASHTSVADLYRESYGEMVRVARLLVGSPEAAADLVQDAFVEVHRRWDDLDRPAAYLRRSVVNRCRGHHRRRLTQRAGMRKLSSGATRDETRELTDAIARLRYRERAAIVLRFYADLPDADIAELLGCRPGTVASLVHRGLERLRKVIEP